MQAFKLANLFLSRKLMPLSFIFLFFISFSIEGYGQIGVAVQKGGNPPGSVKPSCDWLIKSGQTIVFELQNYTNNPASIISITSSAGNLQCNIVGNSIAGGASATCYFSIPSPTSLSTVSLGISGEMIILGNPKEPFFIDYNICIDNTESNDL